ncbi:MAG TPA: radical SAM protein [Victivallales bacterium]|nr:radical SAM protein [Victivallales bacterium]
MNTLKSKNIILINLPTGGINWTEPKTMVWPTTAILLIGSILSRHGYSVKIIDVNIKKNYMDQLKNIITHDTLYIGFSVMVSQVYWALKISEDLKKLNKYPLIVWGGPHPTLYPKQTIHNENVDIVVINEGTQAALNIAKVLENKESLNDIKGIYFKNKTGEIISTGNGVEDNISSIPFFDYSLLDVNEYLSNTKPSVYEREYPFFDNKIKIMPIFTGMGCPYRCQFCINVILKRRYRFKKAEDIVNEIEILLNKYDVNTFLFLDEDFFISKKRTAKFLDIIEEKQLNFNWRMWCRVDHINEDHVSNDIIKRLGKIGYGSIVMGAESGSQAILDSLKKDITLKQIINSLNIIMKSSKVFPRYSFMVGLENETFKQACSTYKFCIKMKKTYPYVDIACPVLFRLYPGSPIFERLIRKYNIILPSSLKAWSDFLLETNGKIESLSFSNMMWMSKKLIQNYEEMDFYYKLAELYIIKKYSKYQNNTKVKIIKKVLLWILGHIAIFRIKTSFYKLAIEKIILKKI